MSECIPDWFDVDSYEGLKNLSLIDFGFNLLARAHIRYWLTNRVEWEKEPMNRLIELVKTKPALIREDFPDYLWKGWIELFDKSRIGKRSSVGLGVVSSLSIATAYDIYREINEDTELRGIIAKYDYYKDSTKQSDFKNWYERDFWLRSLNESETQIADCFLDDVIQLDLTATDEQLIDGFKDWLKSKRMILGDIENPNKYSRIPLTNLEVYKNRLISAAVIPYLDLRMSEILNNSRISWYDIGPAIFPVSIEKGTAEVARKTTDPLAKQSMSYVLLFLRKAIIETSTEDII